MLKSLGEISISQQQSLETFAAQLAASNELSRTHANQLREELGSGLNVFSNSLRKQMTEIATLQKNQLDTFAAQLVKLRYFAGLSVEEAAKLMGLSRTIAYERWTYARAWLHYELHGQDPKSGD